jgi:hypothetical protein
MRKTYMTEKLRAKECLDVNRIGKALGGGRFLLRRVIRGMDYCDAQNERWIHSIGRDRRTKNIIASVGYELYQNPRYDCLWLR